jgi:hypothetical protein
LQSATVDPITVVKRESIVDEPTIESEELELVDLGDVKQETRYGFHFPPTDGIVEYWI